MATTRGEATTGENFLNYPVFTLLEEALIDSIPVIAIDPKGDLANLLLTFPNLAADDFKPWVFMSTDYGDTCADDGTAAGSQPAAYH